MPDMSISVEFEVFCATCGDGLCGQTDVDDRKKVPSIRVEACEKCADAAKEAGHEEGYKEGYDDAVLESD